MSVRIFNKHKIKVQYLQHVCCQVFNQDIYQSISSYIKTAFSEHTGTSHIYELPKGKIEKPIDLGLHLGPPVLELLFE